ncbi:MAG: hypothetical protein AB3N16_15970 [Flavobacteriaceae bacterium]
MKTMKFLSRLLSLVLIVSLGSCSPEDGEDGATGPQGPQGEQGVQGPQGETGTANVIYSDWIQANYLNTNPVPSNVMGLATFSPSELNVANDVVLVYGGNNINGDFEIFPLPYLRNGNIYFTFGLFSPGETGNLQLQIRPYTLDGTNASFSYFDYFRYVVIPGGTSTSGKSSSIDYTKMSYKEIIALFNIPE